MNFYSILGVPMDAHEEAIRSAYRVLARRYHPDSGMGSNVEKFRQINEAYETLRDAGRRRLYDLSLARARRPVMVRIDPMTTGPEPFRQERVDALGDLFYELMRALEDDFYFGRRWPR